MSNADKIFDEIIGAPKVRNPELRRMIEERMKRGGAVMMSKGGMLKKAAKAFDLPPASAAQKTQIPGTEPTYRKAKDILDREKPEGRTLDYGSGLGIGSRVLGAESFEPFPREGVTPTFIKPEDIPTEAFDRLVNLNMLNVVPRDVRDAAVENIGRVMRPGGMGLVTTRGKDVMKASGEPGPEANSMITSIGTYQKGFTPEELREYLKYILGSDYDIGRLNLGPAGAVVRKKGMKEGGEVHMAGGGDDFDALKKLTPFYGAKPAPVDEEEEEAGRRLKDLEGRVLERNYVEPQKFDLTGEARARLQTGLEKVMPRGSARRATSTMLGGEGSNLPFGMGLADVTPAGLPLFGFEAGQSLGRSYEAAKRGDIGEAALEGTIGTLGILPAAPFAVSGAKATARAAKKAAPAAREAARGALESAMESGAIMDPRMAVVKPTGGQWLDTGRPMLRPRTYEDQMIRADFEGADHDRALINWRDKQLTKYVKTQMGSPEDPILKLAESWPAERASMLDERRARIASLEAKRKAIEDGPVPAEVRDPDAWRQARTRTIEGDIASVREEMDNINEMSPIHMPMQDVYSSSDIAARREAAGFPAAGTAQSDFGRMWENLSDRQIKNIDAWKLASEEYLPKIFKAEQENITAAFKPGLMAAEPPNPWLTSKQAQEARLFGSDPDFSRQVLEKNPWLSKLDPGEQVYALTAPDRIMSNLGFNHIMDVLRSDLRRGDLKPEDLSRLSVTDAVKRASRYDAEKAAQMAKAEATSAANLTPHREFGGGYRLVQLDKPGQFSKESQLMGHSVEGYEPPSGHSDWIDSAAGEGSLSYGHGGWEGIKSGEAQVLSFRDTKNRPHATIEMMSNPQPYPISDQEFAQLDAQTQAQYGEYVRQWRRRNLDVEELTDEHVAAALAEAGVPPRPPVITQIKGKRNGPVSEDYWPYLQRYVRESGAFVSDDLDKIGLIDMRVRKPAYTSDPDKVKNIPDYITESEKQRLRSTGEFTPDPHFSDPKFGPKGMKRGGYVTKSIPEFAKGGIVIMKTGGQAQQSKKRSKNG